jgi:anti-sigma factor RsiW
VTSCDEVRPLLADHALGSLDPDGTLAVRRHLRGCAACRRELDALREGVGVFAAALARPAPSDLHDRVLGALAEEWSDLEVARPRGRGPRGPWVAVAAAVALALVAGAFGATPAEGSVVAYESSHDQSFVVVFVRTPDLRGTGSLLVRRADGTTWDPGPIEFDRNGDASTWWVSDRSIAPLSSVTVRAPDGSLLATASLHEA